MLTWEFPPFIAGGLGMACYGLVKAMLKQGVEIDLVMPTTEEVYFPMRAPEDADILPIAYLDPSRGKIKFEKQTIENLIERLRTVGAYAYPESYLTPGFSFENFIESVWNKHMWISRQGAEAIRTHLRGDSPLFRKVQELTSRMMKFASVLSCDLIHVHDWLTYPAGVALKGMLGKKLVAHMHATEFDRAGGPGDDRIHNIEYMGLSNADRVIAVSQYTAQMVIDRYRIEPSKIKIVHNAYSVSSHDGQKRRRLFKDPLILFMGRITLQKGPDYFLEVADRVIRRYPNVRFVMAGSGDMFSRILRTSASKRLKDRFLFSGFLNREQVSQILSATDIFVMPSVSEPFGIVPLEAMAFGAVAIVSKQSGVSEVIENAFKIDFWDVNKTAEIIIDLLGHPDKMEEIAKAGKEEVMRIGWQKAAENAIDVYRGLGCSI
jgi:glycosyltransferase involved in cell wall biosynthesis